MPRLPYLPLYTGDWLKDPNLRRCSQAARGVWIDLLCFMFDCEERGVLATGGVPWTDQQVAAAICGNPDLTITCLMELLSAGVVSRNKSGALFSRRMVRDEENRAKTRGRVKKHRSESSNGDVTHDVTGHPDNDIEISSKEIDLEAFEVFWKAYPQGRKLDKKATFTEWKRQSPMLPAVLVALDAWKKCQQWQDSGLIPHAIRFLKRRQWEEAPAEDSNGQTGKRSAADERSERIAARI